MTYILQCDHVTHLISLRSRHLRELLEFLRQVLLRLGQRRAARPRTGSACVVRFATVVSRHCGCPAESSVGGAAAAAAAAGGGAGAVAAMVAGRGGRRGRRRDVLWIRGGLSEAPMWRVVRVLHTGRRRGQLQLDEHHVLAETHRQRQRRPPGQEGVHLSREWLC